MTTARDGGEQGGAGWVDLEAILVARTVHLHALSPLHLPSRAGKSVAAADLDAFSDALASHLTARLVQPHLYSLASAGSTAQRDGSSNASVVNRVRASFLDTPGLRPHKENRGAQGRVPPPFVVEIEIVQPSPTATDANRKQVETAHLLFFSTGNRQSPSHYPLLLWKAPLSARAAPQDGGQQHLVGGDDAVMDNGIPPAVTARLLTSQTLYFVAAYFDCRLSTLAPLHSIRGHNLEDIAEKVVEHAWRHSRRDSLAMELTYALPSQVQNDQGPPEEGPAPELNTISLAVPSSIVEELLTGADSSALPVMPAVHEYLALHTSIHLSRLTLTRVGVANVFLGAPTSTVNSSGRASSGEVRLKISRQAEGQGQAALLVAILQQLVRIADEEAW